MSKAEMRLPPPPRIMRRESFFGFRKVSQFFKDLHLSPTVAQVLYRAETQNRRTSSTTKRSPLNQWQCRTATDQFSVAPHLNLTLNSTLTLTDRKDQSLPFRPRRPPLSRRPPETSLTPRRRRRSRNCKRRIQYGYLRTDAHVAPFEILCTSCDNWIRSRPNLTHSPPFTADLSLHY
ncbi:hypothetical protein B0H16DRAFT_1778736 [Mycena metata]|uniref:Uncharacterized protein n=1 Tax=Mycena metata TaxID=1033252 RepID=A0AAD7JS04_9AGAR|nr:hypothetical protein B0H16DRAFT_1778736 [Mycena metata]